tara:strand:+ start:34519 stop:36213 length:1695 start_codon:yes stop_codon:yes gene_type:complete
MVAWLALTSTPALAKVDADLILHNGTILTVDDQFSVAQAVVVDDGRIVAIGDEAIVAEYDAPNIIDLNGRTAMPGFMDTHFHPGSRSPRSVPANQASSIAELQEMVRKKAEELGPGEWVTGYGWAEANLAENRNVTRADLDVAAPDNPVALLRAGGHSVAGNSRALALAGLDDSSPDPQRGVLERDANGALNGIIRERADLLVDLVPTDTPDSLRQGYIDDLARLTTLGITSVIIAATSIRDEVDENLRPEVPKTALTYKQLQSIYAEFGPFLPRAAASITHPGAAALAAYPHHTGDGDLRLRLGPIGEAPAVDGGFTGPTAWTSEDYRMQPGFRGQPFFDDEADLQALADDVAKNGWQLGLHAIGDAAIDMAAKVYAQSLEKYGIENGRWFLAHYTMLPTTETMDLMAERGILAAAQPNFLYTLEDRYVQTLDGDRLEHINPLAVPQEHGVFLALGSDNLPTDPRVGLYAAVTRKGRSGRVFGPSEAVSIEEAIRAYTANGPYLTFEEDEKGTLEVGKLADIIVLDRNPLTIAPDDLLTMQVDLTLINGLVVYNRLTTLSSQN